MPSWFLYHKIVFHQEKMQSVFKDSELAAVVTKVREAMVVAIRGKFNDLSLKHINAASSMFPYQFCCEFRTL